MFAFLMIYESDRISYSIKDFESCICGSIFGVLKFLKCIKFYFSFIAEMERSRSLTPVESDKLNTATFFRRATSSSSSSPSHQLVTPKLVHVQPFIPDTVAEETEDDEKDMEMKDDDEEGEEDVLMKSLESETMGMHLCKSDECSRDATIGGALPSMDDAGARGMTTEAMPDDDEEKENIPSRTPTDTDETNHSQISSNFSSTASLFSFNFEIKEEDLDLLESSRSKASTLANIPKNVETVDSNLMRGLDNRASDSTSSSGGTPTKRSGKKRNRGKRKQQQRQQQQNEQNQDNQESDTIRSPKEALLTESPKIELAAKEGFKFDFPEPDEKVDI